MISKQQIKYIRLLREKKYRDEEGVFVIEGLKSVNEAIDNLPELLKMICVSKGYKLRNKISQLPQNCALSEISVEEFLKISSLKTPQGILAVLKQPSEKLPDLKYHGDLIFVLEKIQNPGNLGTIIRIADWFGISNVICSEDSVDCYNPKVIQASMGAILRVGVFYTDLINFIEGLKEETNFTVFGTALDGENIFHAKLHRPAVIVFGNEANGISDELHKMIDHNLLIPNFSNNNKTSESLNVSIATAIVCAEFRRQLLFSHSK